MNKSEFRALVEKRLADKFMEINNLTDVSIRLDFGGKLDNFADFVAVIEFTKAGYFRYIDVCTWNYCDEKLEGRTFILLNAGQMHLQFKEIWPSITQAETAALIGCSQGLVSYHLKEERAKMRMGVNACNEDIKGIQEQVKGTRHAWYDLKKGTVYDVYNGQGEKMFRATYKNYLEWDEECVFVVCGTYLHIENHEMYDLVFEEVTDED